MDNLRAITLGGRIWDIGQRMKIASDSGSGTIGGRGCMERQERSGRVHCRMEIVGGGGGGVAGECECKKVYLSNIKRVVKEETRDVKIIVCLLWGNRKLT